MILDAPLLLALPGGDRRINCERFGAMAGKMGRMRKLYERLGLVSQSIRREASTVPFPAIAPEEDLAVIGDVHGMLRPFEQLLERLESEAPRARIICVGDLIDRGEESADVLRLTYNRRDRVTVLLGNHEEMVLRFLDEPELEGERWLRNGGLQTLASFSLARPRPGQVVALRDRLREELGAPMESWLRRLPRSLASGNVLVTHAGADPWLPVSQQPAQALTWGHPDCGRRRRTDGIWVVRGHTIVSAPEVVEGVISVDTGAFAGGGLSAALISQGSVHFLSAAG